MIEAINKFKAGALAATVAIGMAAGAGGVSAATLYATDNIGDTTGTYLLGQLDINKSLIEKDFDGNDLAANHYRYEVTITNVDDPLNSWVESYITAFYLISNPASTYEGDNSANFGLGVDEPDPNLPPDKTAFNFCLETDPNGNCTGSKVDGAVALGASQTFDLIVSATSEPTFYGVGFRWQALNNGDDITGGSAKGVCLENCSDKPVIFVPEVTAAGSVAALGSIFGLMAFMFEYRGSARRRRSAA